MPDHTKPVPLTETRQRDTPDGGQPTADTAETQRHQLRVVLPDEPALPPIAAATLLRLLRTADRKRRQTPSPTIGDERRAA